MPMKFIISSQFGAVEQIRNGVPHTGIDIPLEMGTKLRSIIDGTVERIVHTGGQGLGNGVIIRGTDGNAYIFGHLSKITVKQGQHITAGQDIIGLSGNSGYTSAPHLHFGIQAPDGHFIDPTPTVKYLEGVTGGDPFNQYLGDQPEPGTFLDWLNKWGDHAAAKQNNIAEHIAHPVQSWIQDKATDLARWFIENIPDIWGYGAIIAGICIILGSMVGKGGAIKPLAFYAGTLLIAALIRTGAH